MGQFCAVISEIEISRIFYKKCGHFHSSRGGNCASNSHLEMKENEKKTAGYQEVWNIVSDKSRRGEYFMNDDCVYSAWVAIVKVWGQKASVVLNICVELCWLYDNLWNVTVWVPVTSPCSVYISKTNFQNSVFWKCRRWNLYEFTAIVNIIFLCLECFYTHLWTADKTFKWM